MKKLLISTSAALAVVVAAAVIARTPHFALAQDVKSSQGASPKTLDDVRKLEQSKPVAQIAEQYSTAGTAYRLEVGFLRDDPFAAEGVPDPLPTLDEARERLNRLVEMLKSENADDQAKGRARADDILTTYFLADMKARISELDEIKARVAAMETRLEKRLQAKAEIIELQKKVLLSEADGLGFFGPTDAQPTASRYYDTNPNVPVEKK